MQGKRLEKPAAKEHGYFFCVCWEWKVRWRLYRGRVG